MVDQFFTLKIHRVSFFFRALHFLQDFGKCERLHGHDYFLEAEFRGPQDTNQVVIDFQILKKDLLHIIKQYDQQILIAENAPNLSITNDDEALNISLPNKNYIFPKTLCNLLPIKATTVEELCNYFYQMIKLTYSNLDLKIILYETKGNQVSFGDF